MLKSPKNRSKNAAAAAAPPPAPPAPNQRPISDPLHAPTPPHAPTPKLVAVIKNNLTEQEMDASGEHWVNHKGPYMTIAETLAYAAARAATRAAAEQTEAFDQIASKTRSMAIRSAHLLRVREERKQGISHRRHP
jgi:hypothetical protein